MLVAFQLAASVHEFLCISPKVDVQTLDLNTGRYRMNRERSNPFGTIDVLGVKVSLKHSPLHTNFGKVTQADIQWALDIVPIRLEFRCETDSYVSPLP